MRWSLGDAARGKRQYRVCAEPLYPKGTIVKAVGERQRWCWRWRRLRWVEVGISSAIDQPGTFVGPLEGVNCTLTCMNPARLDRRLGGFKCPTFACQIPYCCGHSTPKPKSVVSRDQKVLIEPARRHGASPCLAAPCSATVALVPESVRRPDCRLRPLGWEIESHNRFVGRAGRWSRATTLASRIPGKKGTIVTSAIDHGRGDTALPVAKGREMAARSAVPAVRVLCGTHGTRSCRLWTKTVDVGDLECAKRR
jgi:hypothetical protein